MRQWEEEAPGNLCGAARALTTLAPMPRRAVWRKVLMFWLRRLYGPPAQLKELSFIHFARTALVTRLNDGTSASARAVGPAYIYFESYFNGPFDAYIDAFAYVAQTHMRRIWHHAYGFPGPTPASLFKCYIRSHDYPAAHFYSAYPEATATDVSRALTLKHWLTPLVGAARDAEPEEFADRWKAVLRRIPPPRGAQGSLRNVRWTLPRLVRRPDPNFALDGQVYGLTVLSPIRPGHEEALDTGLEPLRHVEHSPFADVPRTHFARLVVIDRFPQEPQVRSSAPVPLPHLLFSCIIDGHPDSYLRSLCELMPETVDSVWGHCVGAPKPASGDPRDFQRWMRRNQIQTTTFFAPYSEATVQDVRAALALRREVESFASRTQYETGRTLQQEFLEKFVDPSTGRLR